MNGVYLYDGVKTISALNLDSDVGWTIMDSSRTDGIDALFQRVPWLYRGVIDRANNVAAIPFALLRNGEEYDISAQWQNRLVLFDNPNQLLKRLEMSLTMAGRAYLFLETNPSGYVKKIRYISPYSITEIYDQGTGELVGYERNTGRRRDRISVDNIVAVYDPDYMTEAGPGTSSAAQAALTAAGVLYNSDRFIVEFFKRGAIKATILAIDGGGRDEAERLQSWWRDVVAGIKNAWAAFVLRAPVIKPTVIGEGLESLQNDSLTRERRQDIATALGIPESRLWSAAANYATAEQDTKNYYLSTIIPECSTIAAALNAQLFTRAHHLEMYRWEFRPETLDIMREDVSQQAAAATAFVEFLTACPTAEICRETAAMMGFELSDAMLAAIDKHFAERREPEPAAPAQAMPPPAPPQPEPERRPAATDEEVRAALSVWRKKSLAAVKRGEPADVEFHTVMIPQRLQDALHYELAACQTEEQVKQAFASFKQPDPDDILREAMDLLRSVTHETA